MKIAFILAMTFCPIIVGEFSYGNEELGIQTHSGSDELSDANPNNSANAVIPQDIKIFTVDHVDVEFLPDGTIICQNETSLSQDFTLKILRFSEGKDHTGKTASQKIQEGCADTLAKTLVRWDKYACSGFNIDPNTEKIILKAAIRFIGIGVTGTFVCLENGSAPSGKLEKAIHQLVGSDHKAIKRIATLINPSEEASKPVKVSYINVEV